MYKYLFEVSKKDTITVSKQGVIHLVRTQNLKKLKFLTPCYTHTRIVLIFMLSFFETLSPIICDVLFCNYDLNLPALTFVIVFFILSKLTVSFYL